MNKNTDSYFIANVPEGLSRNSGLAVLRRVVQQSLATVHSLQYKHTLWVQAINTYLIF